jgi:hypothetical protein
MDNWDDCAQTGSRLHSWRQLQLCSLANCAPALTMWVTAEPYWRSCERAAPTGYWVRKHWCIKRSTPGLRTRTTTQYCVRPN